MLSWEDIVKNYISKYSTQIRKTTQPLRDHFGIGYFTYHRIDNAGKYTVLVDRPDWAEYYVDEQIYLNDPYLRHPSVYQSGISLIDSHGSPEYKETVVKAGRKVLNMEMGAILIQKQEDFVEFFGFSANKKTSSLESLYLNQPQLLTSFATHFKKEMGSVLMRMEKETDSLKNLKGNDFTCSQPIYPDITPATLLAYYKDIGMDQQIEKLEKLSVREKQCLKLLVQDKSAKETAAALGLSGRTVESYFENIKNKLGCWSKHEVLQRAKSYEEIGIL